MTKDEIKEKLRLVMDRADPYDRIGYLDYDIWALELYIRSMIDNKCFCIIKKQSDAIRLRPKLETECATIFYPPGNNHFLNRACIAIGLGVVADCFLPDGILRNNIGFGIDVNKVMYFTQRMLQDRTGLLHNSACFRDEYALFRKTIPQKLSELFNYQMPTLPTSEEREIGKLIHEVHKMMPDNGLLDHDIRLVGHYIADEKKMNSFVINRRKSDKLMSHKATMLCYDQKMTIIYSLENDPLEQRVIMGHELGNLLCHWSPGRNGAFSETVDEQKEATYFSRLLLEYRTGLYLDGNKNDPRFKQSCEEIAQAIRRVYSSQPWLDWVLKDD